MGKKYDCLFFDLDRTLWDVDMNQKEALRIMYFRYGLNRSGIDFETCFSLYATSNARLWDEYRDGKVSRETLRHSRFEEMLAGIGMSDPTLTLTLSDAYVRLAPTFRNLIPRALPTVRMLSGYYPMYIVTNGFAEVQHIKLANCGLAPYFRGIICSEEAGANKPSSVIFEYALRKAGTRRERTLMIGDDCETDIVGANRSGIDSVWFNPDGKSCRQGKPSYEIRSLDELTVLLRYAPEPATDTVPRTTFSRRKKDTPHSDGESAAGRAGNTQTTRSDGNYSPTRRSESDSDAHREDRFAPHGTINRKR